MVFEENRKERGSESNKCDVTVRISLGDEFKIGI